VPTIAHTPSTLTPSVADEIESRFPGTVLAVDAVAADAPVVWVGQDTVLDVLRFLKQESERTYPMLFDLAATDERERTHREGLPEADFTLGYQLLSLERNEDVMVRVPLSGSMPSAHSATGIFENANWYEREAFDMFGIGFDGHPCLRRILLPPLWEGHPLRKEHPARATDMAESELTEATEAAEEEALRFRPEEWGLSATDDGSGLMFLNVGPNHPGTHGLLRVVLQLDGSVIVDAVPDIGYHHRGAEKMAERQSWHTYIPYTDRIDYLGGLLNEMPYLLAIERLAGIEVPERARVVRIMLSELFRVISHLVWYGTFAQDIGALSPAFYTFNDRERAFGIIEAICGARMHPNWFRIGGLAEDLPQGWDRLVLDFLDYMPGRLAEYHRLIMGNLILRKRTKGVGVMSADDAVARGVTGPNLRACGVEWDFRKKRPYSGYEQFDFEIPTADEGDCYARAVVRVAEIRQSLSIIRQCAQNMPSGPVKSEHPLATPPRKERTMHDIETLITHFLGVSWGPVIPHGEAQVITEASKGATAHWLVSDGGTSPYRDRIRTPSFPHLQAVPHLTRGRMIADLLAILGSLDYVLSDSDR
jgi:NADH-quinone oxidoreductase subunit C/D